MSWQLSSSQDLALGQSRRIPFLQRIWNGLVHVIPPLGAPKLLRRAAFNVFFVVLLKLGGCIPLAGLDRSIPQPHNIGSTEGGRMGMANTLSIFMLDMSPAVLASVIVSIANLLPSMRNYIRSKPGQEGNATQSYGRRWLALFIALIMGYSFARDLHPLALPGEQFFMAETTLTLAAGSTVITHLLDEVHLHGLGEGISLCLFTNMLQRQQQVFVSIASKIAKGLISWKVVGAIYAVIAALMIAAIYVSLTEMLYDLVSYGFRPKVQSRHGKRVEDTGNSFPLRIAPSGVSCLLTLNLYKGVFVQLMAAGVLPFKISIRPLLRPMLVAVLAFLAVFIDLSGGRDAEYVSEHMQESNIGIEADPALIPGKETAVYISHQVALTRFWGGLVVGAICGATYALDLGCEHFLGINVGASTMLLLTGYFTVLHRQVMAASELPSLGRKLALERQAVQQFS